MENPLEYEKTKRPPEQYFDTPNSELLVVNIFNIVTIDSVSQLTLLCSKT